MTDVATEVSTVLFFDETDSTEELPELNLQLLRDLVFWAEGDEERLSRKFEGEWDQSSWAKQIRNGECRTAYCIAGQCVVQEGHRLFFDEVEELEGGSVVVYAHMTTEDEEIDLLAQEILGLTDEEADHLFYPDNTVFDLKQIASNIAARRGLTF